MADIRDENRPAEAIEREDLMEGNAQAHGNVVEQGEVIHGGAPMNGEGDGGKAHENAQGNDDLDQEEGEIGNDDDVQWAAMLRSSENWRDVVQDDLEGDGNGDQAEMRGYQEIAVLEELEIMGGVVVQIPMPADEEIAPLVVDIYVDEHDNAPEAEVVGNPEAQAHGAEEEVARDEGAQGDEMNEDNNSQDGGESAQATSRKKSCIISILGGRDARVCAEHVQGFGGRGCGSRGLFLTCRVFSDQRIGTARARLRRADEREERRGRMARERREILMDMVDGWVEECEALVRRGRG